MEKKLFKNLSAGDFYMEVTNYSYAETQEGFDQLCSEINSRINSCFNVNVSWLKSTSVVEVVINFFGSRSSARIYKCFFRHSDIYLDIARIEDILTAFACGLGYE